MASHNSSWSSVVVIPSTSAANARDRHAGDTDSSTSPFSYEEISAILDERRDERPWTQHIECAMGQSTLSDQIPDDNQLDEMLAAQHTRRATSQGDSDEMYSSGSNVNKSDASESDSDESDGGENALSEDELSENNSNDTSSRQVPPLSPLFLRPGDPRLFREVPRSHEIGKLRTPIYPWPQSESLQHRKSLSTKIYEMIDGLRAGQLAITIALEKVNIPAVRHIEKSWKGVSEVMSDVALNLRGLDYHVCSGNIPRHASFFWVESWAVLDSVEDCNRRLWHLLDTVEENVAKCADYNQQILGMRLSLFAQRLESVGVDYLDIDRGHRKKQSRAVRGAAGSSELQGLGRSLHLPQAWALMERQ